MVYPDGSLVKGPKALCELQGYVYDAWVGMAEVFDALGKPERAQALRAKASSLFDRFNHAFWDEELGCYAYALDGEKKKVLSVASNAGHCLWSGIAPPERAKKVVDRLMAPDMWTGWGIRTLSKNNPAFNPYNYQTGSIWPHDNAIIAFGFKRYGFGAEAARITHDISVAASHFKLNQLQSFIRRLLATKPNFQCIPRRKRAAGLGRRLRIHADPGDVGIPARRAAQQAVRRSFAPEWLPDLVVHDLRVGQHKIDIRFWREDSRRPSR